MKVIIVAGGKGKRLRPFTNSNPKPMVKVHGKPVLEHIIADFKYQGIKDFIISLCYLSENVTKYFGDGKKFGVRIEYLFENAENPLGTAGSIAGASQFIDSPFIVSYADVLREIDLSDMISQHKKNKGLATIGIYKRFGPNPKSKIEFDNTNQVTFFIERPGQEINPSQFVWSNAAIYIFEPEIFTYIPKNTFLDFGKDIFPLLLKNKKKMYAYPLDGQFIDVGDNKKLRKAREMAVLLS